MNVAPLFTGTETLFTSTLFYTDLDAQCVAAGRPMTLLDNQINSTDPSSETFRTANNRAVSRQTDRIYSFVNSGTVAPTSARLSFADIMDSVWSTDVLNRLVRNSPIDGLIYYDMSLVDSVKIYSQMLAINTPIAYFNYGGLDNKADFELTFSFDSSSIVGTTIDGTILANTDSTELGMPQLWPRMPFFPAEMNLDMKRRFTFAFKGMQKGGTDNLASSLNASLVLHNT
jgi:hypothetical protein